MIYLDNAATSYPKPPGMAEFMARYILSSGANYGRGGYSSSIKTSEDIFGVRIKLAQLLGTDSPERIVFTKNATEALNIAILGIVSRGSTVVVSPLEHNSVMRPLNFLGCKVNTLPLLPDGSCDVSRLSCAGKPSLVVLNHASNVSGVISDVDVAAEYCKRHNIPCLIDASQSIGHVPVRAQWGAMIAFAGHKGLLGPQGTGALYIPENYFISPLMTGGTGSSSELLSQPDTMPDRFESGTLNAPAVLALGYSCQFLERHGLEAVNYHEKSLTLSLIEGLSNIRGVHLICPQNKNRTPVLSFCIDGVDVVETGCLLDKYYGIAVRCGLHCAPCAHRAYGTLEQGTIRVSPGPFTTRKDIDKFLSAINSIAKNA